VADKNEVWLSRSPAPAPEEAGAQEARPRPLGRRAGSDDSFFVGANRSRITEVNPK
jgi:hypothetical protein